MASTLRQETLNKIRSIIDKEISDLFDKWQENGVDEEIVAAHAKFIENQIIRSFKEMVSEYKNASDPNTIVNPPTDDNKLAVEELELNVVLNQELEETGSLLDRNFNDLLQKIQDLKQHRLQFMMEVEEMEAYRKTALHRAERDLQNLQSERTFEKLNIDNITHNE